MSTLEAAVSPASLPAPVPAAASAAATVRFFGDGRSYWRLLIRGAVLLMFTLGIYRFWLATDIRRFLWSGIELSGDSFEYTSGVPLSTPSGFMAGTYGMIAADGETFDIEVPAFSLDSPGTRAIN